mmetsp:Transcript_83287/g.231844  ORF Transcript_83287/g.231844 Transcript_83287/m.231844 type:complete len:220 (-) Transcript_83287:600-1259(-)
MTSWSTRGLAATRRRGRCSSRAPPRWLPWAAGCSSCTRSTSTCMRSGRSSRRACTCRTARASAPAPCSARRCASTCSTASLCSRRSGCSGGGSSRSCSGSCAGTRTPSTCPRRASASGTATARGNSSTSEAWAIARRWTWGRSTAFSGGTSGRSTSTCTRTTPARAWTSSPSVSAKSRRTPPTAASSSPRGTPLTWGRWRCRRATCSASSTWPTASSLA